MVNAHHRAIYSLTTLERLHNNSNYNHTKHSPQKLRSHSRTMHWADFKTHNSESGTINPQVDCFKLPSSSTTYCRRWQAWLPLWWCRNVRRTLRHRCRSVSDVTDQKNYGRANLKSGTVVVPVKCTLYKVTVQCNFVLDWPLSCFTAAAISLPTLKTDNGLKLNNIDL